MAKKKQTKNKTTFSRAIGIDYIINLNMMLALRAARRLRMPSLKEQFRNIPAEFFFGAGRDSDCIKFSFFGRPLSVFLKIAELNRLRMPVKQTAVSI